MPYKKLIIILSIVLLLLTAVLLVYYIFFRTSDSDQDDITNDKTDQIIDDTDIYNPPVGFKAISSGFTVAPTVREQIVKYLDPQTSQLIQTGILGDSSQIISSYNLADIFLADWSAEGNQVIFKNFEDNTINNYYFNLDNNQLTPLDSNIQSVSFAPDANQIVYHYLNQQSGAENISIANPDGSNWQNIVSINLGEILLDWVSVNHIAIQTKASGLAQGSLLRLNPGNKQFSVILENKYGLTSLWSFDGSKVLYSETDSSGRNLSLKAADQNGQNIATLDIITLPDKCVWSQDNRTLYCAVFNQIPDNVILPDDYYLGTFTGPDKLWVINIDTKQKSLILPDQSLPNNLDAANLILSNQEDYLFFINKTDGRLYSLEL